MTALQGPAAIRHFFHHNHIPLYYVSTSTFNLLGAEAWINNLTFINTTNSFDGRHPHIFVPHDALAHGLQDCSSEQLSAPPGGGGLCAPAGTERRRALFDVWRVHREARSSPGSAGLLSPSAALRRSLDSKVTTTCLANRAGVPSVPNVLARVDSYATLRRVAHALRPDLVVQLPHGDSGTTTFFISTEADFHLYARQIAAQPAVKIMQRIRCRQLTIEGCVTRHGTLVGPLMTEMIGFDDLTPYRGGWCGNEVFGEGVSSAFPKIRQQAQRAAVAIGEHIRAG